MRFTVLTALMTVALVVPSVPNVHAQSNQLEESQMAVMSFDFHMDQIRKSEMAGVLDLESKMESLPNADKFDQTKVNRIFGASSAPASMEVAQSYQGEGPLPVEAFVRMEFVDSAAADEVMEKIETGGEAVEMGGKTYYKSTEDKAPENFMAHRVDETTVEMGTEAYLLRSDRKVFTEGLTAAFKNAPDEAIKIAFDLAGAPELVAELQAMAAENGPPNFAAYYDLIGSMSALHLTADMDGPNLLTLGFTGKSEEEAEEIAGGLGSLVGMGQMMGMGMVGNLKQQSPEVGGMVEKMVMGLKADRADGSNDISVKLIHPEGLGTAIKGMMGE